MFVNFVYRYIGVKPHIIAPADLRLLEDSEAKYGYRLCCVVEGNGFAASTTSASTLRTANGELVQEIHQIGLELHQRELFSLSREMLCQVSLRCFNDMRTILLVHDKRMLGIIKQEIPSLVTRRVLTAAQGHAL